MSYHCKGQDELSDFLREIGNHADDHAWLDDHADEVHEKLWKAVLKEQYQREALTRLIQIQDWILLQTDLVHWWKLFEAATVSAPDRATNDQLMRIWKHMGDTSLIIGQGKQAKVAFSHALGRIQDKDKQRKWMLMIHIGLFKTHMYQQEDDLSEEFVNSVLDRAKAVGDCRLLAELHQALAFAYNFRGETQKVQEYGQMALGGWHHARKDATQANDIKYIDKEFARTAFVLAGACRQDRNWQSAQHYLEYCKRYYVKAEDPRQYALVCYEQAGIYLGQGDYEAAEQWYQKALDEAQRIPDPYKLVDYIAAAHVGLGFASLHQKRFDSARRHFKAGVHYWTKPLNQPKLAGIYNAWGYLEHQVGNIRHAYVFLKRAERLCTRVLEVESIARLKQDINDNLQELRKT